MAKSTTCKLGVVYNADDLSLAEMLQYARRAEEAGVESVWAVEAGRDAFVPLTAMASVLQRVRVGTSIAPWLLLDSGVLGASGVREVQCLFTLLSAKRGI